MPRKPEAATELSKAKVNALANCTYRLVEAEGRLATIFLGLLLAAWPGIPMQT